MVNKMGFSSQGEDNQGWKLYLTSLIMIISAGLFVIARLVTRFQAARLGADDYTIAASLAFSVLLSVAIQLAVAHGYGQHKRDLSTQELRTCLKFFWIAQTPYKVVVCLNKSSIILLYMRIFISQGFRYLCYGSLAIIVSSGLATTFATVWQCVPVERSWNKDIEGICIDSAKFWVANAVINIVTDVIVLALPIWEIFKLQLKFQEKLMLCGVFMLGGFVTITSILRVTAVANSVRNQQDLTWNFIQRGIWTLVEANLGIICACLIVLKRLVKRWTLSLTSTFRSGQERTRLTGCGSGAIRIETSGRADSPFPIAEQKQCYNLNELGTRPSTSKYTGGIGTNSTHKVCSLHPETQCTYCKLPNQGRRSDEKHIMLSSSTEQDFCRSSVNSLST